MLRMRDALSCLASTLNWCLHGKNEHIHYCCTQHTQHKRNSKRTITGAIICAAFGRYVLRKANRNHYRPDKTARRHRMTVYPAICWCWTLVLLSWTNTGSAECFNTYSPVQRVYRCFSTSDSYAPFNNLPTQSHNCRIRIWIPCDKRMPRDIAGLSGISWRTRGSRILIT